VSVVVFNGSPDNARVLLNEGHFKDQGVGSSFLVLEDEVGVEFIVGIDLLLTAFKVGSKVVQKQVVRVFGLLKTGV